MAENSSKQDNPYDVELPQSVIDSFARFILPEIRAFYATPEGQQMFREWQEEHKNKDET